MTIIYVTENNCECLAVTFKNNGMIRVQKLEDVSEDKNIIYKVNPMEIYLGKSESCEMTAFSGAFNKSVFSGNTVLLKISEEYNKHRFVCIGGDKVCSFLTFDEIYKNISNMGNNLTPYNIAIGYENIYYLTPYFRYIKKKNIDVDDIDKLYDIDYNIISNYQKLRTHKIYSNYE